MIRGPRKTLKKGDRDPEVRALVRYLSTYGYLVPDGSILLEEEPEPTAIFDPTIEEAVVLFQESFGLEVTGEVDGPTLEIMKSPRCALPDLVVVPPIADFATPRWDTNDLTFGFASFCPGLTEDETIDLIQEAVDRWAAVTPLSFTLTDFASAHLKIQWLSGSHGDAFDFVGRCQTFGHGFFPPPFADPGHVHFNQDEVWVADNPGSGQVDLLTIATHEIGHALGILDHLNLSSSNVMNARFNCGLVRRDLQPDDIAAIQAIYGA
jgi:Matrixin/Putative peptidoglycan binding domain